MNIYRARASQQFHDSFSNQDMDDELQTKLPEWHRVLREIYAGIENGQNKPGQPRVVRDQAK
jgi:hypothetical protein